MKSKLSIAHLLSQLTLANVALLLIAAGSFAQAPGEPLAIDRATGKTGQFQVTLTQRSSLSKPADVAQRISAKASAVDADYDLTKEKFDIYVPKTPGEDGKFGLMVVIPFPAHATPPHPWTALLEKYHIIFVGDPAAGNGRPPVQRIGLALDAAYGVPKVWSVDENRVYACTPSGSDVASGIALYYPDVFDGAICPGWSWWESLRDVRSRSILKADRLARPHSQQLDLARAHGRFFLVGRQEQDTSRPNPVDLIAKDGYGRSGFKHVKAITVPPPEISIWSTFAADWFEEGLQFLDAGSSEAKTASATLASGKQSASPTTTASPPPNAAAPPPVTDDPAAKAEGILHLAKSYIAAQRYDSARAKLQSVIQTYPQTPAASEAKSLLNEIQGK